MTWNALETDHVHVATARLAQVNSAEMRPAAQKRLKLRQSVSTVSRPHWHLSEAYQADHNEVETEERKAEASGDLASLPLQRLENGTRIESPIDDDSPPYTTTQSASCWMWIFDRTDVKIIDIQQGVYEGPWFHKNGHQRCLWRALVAPVDRRREFCALCGKPTVDHDLNCPYLGQIPCSWCNMFPCKHSWKCSRNNFSCGFCHWYITGHCLGNPHDVRSYRLDSALDSAGS